MRALALAFLIAIAMMILVGIVVAGQEPVIGRGLAYLNRLWEGPAGEDPKPVRFTVHQGDTASEIAERLVSRGLLKSAWSFQWQARLKGVENRLQAGDYELSADMKVSEILSRLQRGRFPGSRVTIPEGWRAEEIADLLEKEGAAGREEFLALVADGRLGDDLLPPRPPSTSLEGYLFPDTYQIPADATAAKVLRMMLQNFRERFDFSLEQRAMEMGLTVHQVVILASIVEREAALPMERALIAGVFLNRLETGMPLEADPTVQYAVAGQAGGSYWKPSLTEADMAIDSPYNTYRYPGLPPGPICNPGLASLRAVLEAPTTEYYYFVARPDGSHAFAQTFEEHLANVRKYGGGS